MAPQKGIMDTENTPDPEVAPQEVETQSAEVVSTENETTPPETKDTEERLYAGKYKTVEEMEKAYEESQSKMTRMAQEAKKSPAEYTPAEPTGNTYFDETTTEEVKSLAEQVALQAFEKKEAEKWVRKHADDLKDRAVDALTRDLIRQGYDRDDALTEAKKELGGRESAVRKEALTEGVQEGQELANKKEQMGAIGTSGTTKIDPDKLSAKEFAKFHGLSYEEQ